ncbi:hypothetical protein [Curtobacterium oceanosedimentum]|uniref:Uncharacterized protein n=1 Tax=Curtobacterium oceanosedimentum TaxID=465820 RepID=A0A147DP32_9MICO|nr:hypothetical protein [Curtobacterium oceanosedimentum]KTR51218.1 hypothetical protein NS359_11385 [Curtobacterium oceanosedimentum]
MTDDQLTDRMTDRDRRTYRIISRTGFVAAPAMFFLPLFVPMFSVGYQSWPIICMTAAFAVLVSASSFAAMASTPPDENPGKHQLWAVPVAVFALLPGAVLSSGLYLTVVSLLSQAAATAPG